VSYLLIDAGNSCLKLAILDEFDCSEFSYNVLDYNNLYDDLYAMVSNCVVSGVVVCNVSNSDVFHIISDVVYNLWRIEPHQIFVQQNKFGLSTRYNNPGLLGADRWVALIAARAEFNKTLCVVDCGTAVTIDVVSEDGMHIGGLITPGLNTARDSLGLKTNNLPFVENTHVDKKPENNNNKPSFLAITTQDAILGGTLYQLSAYIERIVTEIKQEFGENTECIITGGDAEQIQALILHHFHYRETLVLEGLKIVAKDLFDKDSI